MKIENTTCPILLISTADDSVWPSAEIGEIIISKLKEIGYKYSYRHITFEQARREAIEAAVHWIQHIL